MTKEFVKNIYNALSDKKGENIVIIDISQISPISDYMVIVNGNNINQLNALSDAVLETAGKLKVKLLSKEGFNRASWVLMDYGDVIVHIFSKEDRFYYDLERIWRDGRFLSIDEL